MNVLADFLHYDLYYSLHALFEKRLGYQLFCPQGDEWFKRGYLSLYGLPPFPLGKIDTVEDVIKNPNIHFEKSELIDGIYHHYGKMEPDKGHYIAKAITFNKFLEMDFDIILTTYFGHELLFYRLVKEHKPNSIFIRQIANIHEKPLGFSKNILLGLAYHPSDYGGEKQPNEAFGKMGINHIMYYPEHYEGYCYTEPTNHKVVLNLVGNSAPIDIQTFKDFQAGLKDFTFKSVGNIPNLLLPRAIKESGFVWYAKAHGGGGYTLRQALACGRPIIGRRHYSSNHSSIECELYQHGVTCIDLDTKENHMALLEQLAEPSRHIEMCKTTAKILQNTVRFEEKAKDIKDWISTLPRGIKNAR